MHANFTAMYLVTDTFPYFQQSNHNIVGVTTSIPWNSNDITRTMKTQWNCNDPVMV